MARYDKAKPSFLPSSIDFRSYCLQYFLYCYYK